MRILNLQGSPYDVGLQYGRQLRELVGSYYGFCRMLLRDVPENDIAETLSKVECGLRDKYPDALEEMRGIASGSRLVYDDVLLMNFTSEVRSQIPRGCTSFIATEGVTKTGQPIMGKTRDMASQAYFPFQIAMKVCMPGKAEIFLAEAFSGMVVTGCGMNEYGLAITLNAIRSISDTDDTIGVQRAFLARLILEECRNTEEALDLFTKTEMAYQGANFLVCDTEGECALVEKSHCHQALVRANDGVIVTTNHFTDPTMVEFGKPSRGSSNARLERMFSLLSSNTNNVDLSMAQTFLRDHAEGLDGNSICRHVPQGVNTVQAYILEPNAKRIFIADGHPCMSSFTSYKPF